MFLFRVPIWFFWAALTCDVARQGLCGLQLDPKAEVMEILRVLFNFAQFTPFCFLACRGRLREQQKPRSFIRASAGNPLCPLPSALCLEQPASPCLDCLSLLQHPASPTFPFLHLPLFSVPLLPPPCPTSLHSFSFNLPLCFSSLFRLTQFFFPPQQQLSFLNAQAHGTCGSASPYHLHLLLSDLNILPTLIVSLPPKCL